MPSVVVVIAQETVLERRAPGDLRLRRRARGQQHRHHRGTRQGPRGQMARLPSERRGELPGRSIRRDGSVRGFATGKSTSCPPIPPRFAGPVRTDAVLGDDRDDVIWNGTRHGYVDRNCSPRVRVSAIHRTPRRGEEQVLSERSSTPRPVMRTTCSYRSPCDQQHPPCCPGDSEDAIAIRGHSTAAQMPSPWPSVAQPQCSSGSSCRCRRPNRDTGRNRLRGRVCDVEPALTSDSALLWFCGAGVNVGVPGLALTTTGKPARSVHPSRTTRALVSLDRGGPDGARHVDGSERASMTGVLTMPRG